MDDLGTYLWRGFQHFVTTDDHIDATQGIEEREPTRDYARGERASLHGVAAE
jgi:hypothetical protein